MEPDKVEEQADLCPLCGKVVISRWVPGKGCLKSTDYDLIGDFIVHTACFDKSAEAAMAIAEVMTEKPVDEKTRALYESEIGTRICNMIIRCGFTSKDEIRQFLTMALEDEKEADIEEAADMIYNITRKHAH